MLASYSSSLLWEDISISLKIEIFLLIDLEYYCELIELFVHPTTIELKLSELIEVLYTALINKTIILRGKGKYYRHFPPNSPFSRYSPFSLTELRNSGRQAETIVAQVDQNSWYMDSILVHFLCFYVTTVYFSSSSSPTYASSFSSLIAGWFRGFILFTTNLSIQICQFRSINSNLLINPWKITIKLN